MSDEKKTKVEQKAIEPAETKALDPQAPKVETVRARLKPGAKFAKREPPLYRPEPVEPGTVVELTKEQAVAFRDLFERVE